MGRGGASQRCALTGSELTYPRLDDVARVHTLGAIYCHQRAGDHDMEGVTLKHAQRDSDLVELIILTRHGLKEAAAQRSAQRLTGLGLGWLGFWAGIWPALLPRFLLPTPTDGWLVGQRAAGGEKIDRREKS